VWWVRDCEGKRINGMSTGQFTFTNPVFATVQLQGITGQGSDCRLAFADSACKSSLENSLSVDANLLESLCCCGNHMHTVTRPQEQQLLYTCASSK